ncbi:sialidase family protein [Hahella aquimaris]|uniref:sialidase family protein n=1 Tax=Hahella sp. HNIBRBA332 TaxID=3015983 RepID=UPI00273BC81D|nr:sialidase family protein [Hahella sp. HNIBRBA332]WLQ16159.1 sialidase family protein [Hahella sp. HNIBRBA332]
MEVLNLRLLRVAVMAAAAGLASGGVYAHGDKHGAHNDKSGGHHGAAAPAGPCADPMALPSLNCAKSPTPAFGRDGRLWITWYSRGHIYIQHSDDNGATFSAPQAVNPIPEAVDDQGEDRPQVALGPRNEIYLLWTRKLDKPYTGHIRFSRSLDGGRTFSAPINVNDDKDVIAHRFPTFRVNDRGEIFVVWVDKRDLEAAKAANKEYAGAALYYGVSTDNGASFQTSRKLSDNSCECCRIAMELDAQGLPVILYRQVFDGGVRDHALITFSDLTTHSAPQRVSDDQWKLDGCPHHGPAIAASGDRQHLAWFTAGENRQGLFYAHSTKDGFSKPVAFGGPGAERPMIEALGEHVVLTWKAFADDRTRTFMQVSEDGGDSWSAATEVVNTEGASDHPLLVNNGDKIYLSWQTAQEGYRLTPLPGSSAEVAANAAIENAEDHHQHKESL